MGIETIKTYIAWCKKVEIKPNRPASLDAYNAYLVACGAF